MSAKGTCEYVEKKKSQMKILLKVLVLFFVDFIYHYSKNNHNCYYF